MLRENSSGLTKASALIPSVPEQVYSSCTTSSVRMNRRSINVVAVTLIFAPATSLLAYDRGYAPRLTQQEASQWQQLSETSRLAQTATQSAATTMPKIFAGLKKYIVI